MGECVMDGDIDWRVGWVLFGVVWIGTQGLEGDVDDLREDGKA